ncbi:MAG: hypothetical protein V1875_07650 [Candidatus Altiarchaeota archaeon]
MFVCAQAWTDCAGNVAWGGAEAKSNAAGLFMEMPEGIYYLQAVKVKFYVNDLKIRKDAKALQFSSEGRFYPLSDKPIYGTNDFHQVMKYSGEQTFEVGFRNWDTFEQTIPAHVYFYDVRAYPVGAKLAEYTVQKNNASSDWYGWNCVQKRLGEALCNGATECDVCLKILGEVARQYKSLPSQVTVASPSYVPYTAQPENGKKNTAVANFYFGKSDQATGCHKNYGVQILAMQTTIAEFMKTEMQLAGTDGKKKDTSPLGGSTSGKAYEVRWEDAKAENFPCAGVACDSNQNYRGRIDTITEMTPAGSGTYQIIQSVSDCNKPGSIKSAIDGAVTDARKSLASYKITGDPKTDFKSKVCYWPAANESNNATASIQGYVYYVDYTQGGGVNMPIKNAYVVFRYADKSGVRHEDDKKFRTETDDKGFFSYENKNMFAIGNKLDILVDFNNSQHKVSVSSNRGDRRILHFIRGADTQDKKFENYQMNLRESQFYELSELGRLYAEVLRAVEFKENVLKLTGTVAESVHIDLNDGTWHSIETNSPTSRYPPGIWIRANNAEFDDWTAPINREYHEYCHHIYYAELENPTEQARRQAGTFHAGYSVNPDTDSALTEGWAEFCALMISKHYGGGSTGLYPVGGRNTEWNIEANYKIDEKNNFAAEEISIAGVLLDLEDSGEDYGGSDDDPVSLGLDEVWKVFSTPRDYGDGKGVRHIWYARDLYLAFHSLNDPRLEGRFKAGSNRTNLEQVFILHNIFQDKNNDSKYQEGEVPGYSGKYGNLRMDATSQDGTELVMDVTDQNGKKFGGLYADVDVAFAEPNKKLSYKYRLPVIDGQIAVPLPPHDYDTIVTVTAVQGGTNNKATNSFKITTNEMFEKLDPKKPMGTYKATVKTADVSCKKDDECMFYRAGNACKTGKCVTGTVKNTAEASTNSPCSCIPPLTALLAGLTAAAVRIIKV